MEVDAKKARVANMKHVVALTACAAAATASPWSGSASGPMYIPGRPPHRRHITSTNLGARYRNYTDVTPHGRFNPNAMFYRMCNESHNQGHSNVVAFIGRRSLLEFKEGIRTPLDGMPAYGEEEAVDEDGEDDEGDEENKDEGKEGEGKEEEEDEEEGGVEAKEGVDE